MIDMLRYAHEIVNSIPTATNSIFVITFYYHPINILLRYTYKTAYVDAICISLLCKQHNCNFSVSNLNSDTSYDYVLGARLVSSGISPTVKLTSPPIRLRADGKLTLWLLIVYNHIHLSNAYHLLDAHRTHSRISLDDGRHFRRSFGHIPRRSRALADSGSNASSRGHGESNTFSYDEATLRQLLLEYVFSFWPILLLTVVVC